jgi:hypothetical protein
MRAWPLVLLVGCKVKDPPPITTAFTDQFDRAELGDLYHPSGDGYALAHNTLSARGAHNHPLWLRRKLPRDVRIELDCWSTETRGDIKVEVFGDGHSFDPDGGRYTATGYELIFGGWYNAKSEIARLDEHDDKATRVRFQPKVVPNQRYHWKIERKGTKLSWWVTAVGDDPPVRKDADGKPIPEEPFLMYDDPEPLDGDDHAYFGFNNWETDTWFDDLVVTPL